MVGRRGRGLVCLWHCRGVAGKRVPPPWYIVCLLCDVFKQTVGVHPLTIV